MNITSGLQRIDSQTSNNFSASNRNISNRGIHTQQNIFNNLNQIEQNEVTFSQTNNNKPSVKQSLVSIKQGQSNQSIHQAGLHEQQDSFYQRYQVDAHNLGLTFTHTTQLQQQLNGIDKYQSKVDVNKQQQYISQSNIEGGEKNSQESQTNILQNNRVEYEIQTEEQVYPQNVLISFLRKLYFLLLIQTLSILLGVWISYTVPDILQFIVEYDWIVWISLGFVNVISICCFIFRITFSFTPINYISFFLQTLGLIVIYIYILDLYQIELAFLILIALSSIYFSLLAYVLTTKTELNFRGSTLFVTCSAVMIYQLFLIFTDLSYLISIFILMGIVIWGYFLVYEYQTKVSDIELKNRDPIVSTITVFLDIFNLLLKVSELIRQVLIKERS